MSCTRVEWMYDRVNVVSSDNFLLRKSSVEEYFDVVLQR